MKASRAITQVNGLFSSLSLIMIKYLLNKISIAQHRGAK
jgi:hypothetical protein